MELFIIIVVVLSILGGYWAGVRSVADSKVGYLYIFELDKPETCDDDTVVGGISFGVGYEQLKNSKYALFQIEHIPPQDLAK